jgi:uncharacterized membrane protein
MWTKDPRVRRIGFRHLVINVIAVVSFIVNFFVRWNAADHSGPLWLTLFGIALISASGWLGGEMVHRYGAGVIAAPAPSPEDLRTER